jgi:ubiquinone/menaquinone biosynthesis C-methylase UbiE
MTDESTRNPWLSIPASDYEGHMESPSVDQQRLLRDLLHERVEEFRPASLAVLGCATGAGFETIDPATVRRLVAIDINPEYIEIVRRRFAASIPGLELICADVVTLEFPPRSLDLFHAALVLEYVSPEVVAAKVARWLAPGGILSVLLQLPGAHGRVSDTPFASLKSLDSFMKLIDPPELTTIVTRHGFTPVRSHTIDWVGGKKFFAGIYRCESGSTNPG